MALLKREDYLPDEQLPLEIRSTGVRRDTPLDHGHEFTEMVLVVGGAGTHIHGTCAYPIAEGDLFVIASEQQHAYADPRELDVLLFLYDESHFLGRFPELARLSGYQGFFHLEPGLRARHRRLGKVSLPPAKLSRFVAGAELIREEKGSRREGYALRCSLIFAGMLLEICRSFSEDRTPLSRELRRLGDVMAVLEDRFDEPWSLPRLASLVHVSESTLIRYFKRATGKTPMSYLTDVRLARARSMLLSTDLTVSEIALRSGFAEGNYLARTFKSRLKVTPSEFRRRRRPGTRTLV
jgi:AraC-like DNA-binding protein